MMETGQLLSVMQASMGRSQDAFFGQMDWTARPDLDEAFAGTVGEVPIASGKVTCTAGSKNGVIEVIIVNGIVHNDGADEISLLWDDVKDDADHWAATLREVSNYGVSATGVPFWEVTAQSDGGNVTHRIGSGTPPNNTPFPMTGDGARPFWSLIFMAGD